MDEMKDHYQTSLRPLDGNGVPIKPLDIVVLNRIPEHYYSGSETAHLSAFSGCYGLITYPSNGVEFTPYYLGNKEHPGWVSGTGSVVHVLSRKVSGPEIVSWDLWVPPQYLTKIAFNSLIMNIFVEYPWQMQSEQGPGSTLFIREGMEEFQYIKTIMETPLSVLEQAHNAAMKVLMTSSASC